MYAMTGDGHWIREVRDRGKYVFLEDGSKWEISAIDRIDTVLWLPTTAINVSEESDDPYYDYTLINEDDNESVSAKFLGMNKA